MSCPPGIYVDHGLTGTDRDRPGLREAMAGKPELDPQDLFRHVYSEPTPLLREQADLLADELSREEA